MNQQLAIPLPATFATTLPERAQRIRNLVTVARGCIIEIGRELVAASDEVARGEWGEWLSKEFAWSDETARKYIHVAHAFQGQLGWDRSAPPTIEGTALTLLAEPEVPEAAREEAAE